MSEMRNNVGEGWREINNNNGSTLEAGDQWRYAGPLPVDLVWSDIPNDWVGCIACNTEYRFRRRTATEKLGGDTANPIENHGIKPLENQIEAWKKDVRWWSERLKTDGMDIDSIEIPAYESLAKLGEWLFEYLGRRYSAWREQVFRGSISPTGEVVAFDKNVNDSLLRCYESWAETAETILCDRVRVFSESAAGKPCRGLFEALSEARETIKNWKPPRLSLSVGLRDHVMTEEDLADLKRLKIDLRPYKTDKKDDQPPTTKTATVENVFDASDKEIHDKEVLCKKLMDEFDIFALNAEIDRLNKKIADMELTPFQVLRLKAAAIVLEDVPKPDWFTRLAKRLSTATLFSCSDWADEERLNIAWMLRDMAERMGGKNG